MHSTALQVVNSPRSSSTYTEYELLKALDEWGFNAYQITQPVHQKIIRYWARRINFKQEIRKQIGQGETIGVSDETTAARVKCSTRVVAECRRYAKKTGLISYQKKYKRVGIWIMFFDCMVQARPTTTEITDGDGVIHPVFDQDTDEEVTSSQVTQCTSNDVLFLQGDEAENPDGKRVPEIIGDSREKHFNKTTNTTTTELRDTNMNRATSEEPVVVEDEKKALIKDDKVANRHQMVLFQCWKLNRIRNECEIRTDHMDKHYQQIAEVIEYAINQGHCTQSDAVEKLRPVFENATKQFSVPLGLFKSDEGRDLLASHCPLEPAASNLSPNDPSYYDQAAMDETREKNRQKAMAVRQSREQDTPYAYNQELRAKAERIHQRSKPLPETRVEQKQVEETSINGNGGGDGLSREEKRKRVEALFANRSIEFERKKEFHNAIEETKKRIRQASETSQMGLLDWSGVVKE